MRKLLNVCLMLFVVLAASPLLGFDLSRHLDELEHEGVTIVHDLFSPEQMREIRAAYRPIKETVLKVFETDPGKERVFQTDTVTTHSRYWKVGDDFILQAGPGRFDTSYGFREGFFASEQFSDNPKLKQIMDNVLHKEYASYSGVVDSEVGSGNQYWHRDTHNLADSDDDGSQLLRMDDFYFTVLIPLVPLNNENGTTEFRRGTHRKTAAAFAASETIRRDVPLGSAIVFNGKISHRGRGNDSMHDRPVIYMVYHKKWYNDTYREGL